MNAPKSRLAARGRSDVSRRGPRVVSWSEAKQQAVLAAANQVQPEADVTEALGFMPLQMKGAAIRWRGL